jgi:hypothetical protein
MMLAEGALENGLIGYWPFDEHAADLAGNSHGVALGKRPIRFVEGHHGSAAEFREGDQGIGVQLDESLAVHDLRSFTVAFWFRAAPGISSKQILLSNDDTWQLSFERNAIGGNVLTRMLCVPSMGENQKGFKSPV